MKLMPQNVVKVHFMIWTYDVWITHSRRDNNYKLHKFPQCDSPILSWFVKSTCLWNYLDNKFFYVLIHFFIYGIIVEMIQIP